MARTGLALLALWIAGVMVGAGVGCDSGTDSEVVGEIRWDFDYRNWLRPRCGDCAGLGQAECTGNCAWDGAACRDPGTCTEPAVRGCANQPPATDGPPFPAVQTVNVQVLDPDRNQITFERDLPCDDGGDGARYPLRALARKVQRIQLWAFDGDGALLYRTPDSLELDLRERAEHRYQLRTEVGDIRLGVSYPDLDPFTCPHDGVASLRATVTRLDSDDVVAAATQAPACDDACLGGSLCSRPIYIRGIAADPETAGATPVPRTFRVTVEARDSAGATLYCGSDERPIAPGSNDLTGSVALAAGPC